MEHLSFNIICRIADGDINQDEMTVHITHWESCQYCKREVELQQSIIKASRQSSLIDPSINFAQNVLDAIHPSQKKKWSEWFLNNMGNIIAMTLVLAFYAYVISFTKNSAYNNDKSTQIWQAIGFIQNVSHQIVVYLSPKMILRGTNTSHIHTIVFILLAFVLLIFIDQIASRFLRQFKA